MNQSIIAKTDFFIYGPSKTGSSSLIYLLDKHPDINSIEGIKEPRFFQNINITEEMLIDYNSKFPSINKLNCEKSTGYFVSPIAIKNIKEYCKPTVKFITVLRNPVDRLISCYIHFKIIGLILSNHMATQQMRRITHTEGWLHEWLNTEQGDGSSKIFSLMPHITDIINNKFKNYYWIIEHGFYNEHLERFYQYYDKSSMLICLYDNWKHDNKKVLIDICNFLNIDSEFFETQYEYIRYNSTNNWLRYAKQCGLDYDPLNDISDKNISDLYEIYAEHNNVLRSKLAINHNWKNTKNIEFL